MYKINIFHVFICFFFKYFLCDFLSMTCVVIFMKMFLIKEFLARGNMHFVWLHESD